MRNTKMNTCNLRGGTCWTHILMNSSSTIAHIYVLVEQRRYIYQTWQPHCEGNASGSCKQSLHHHFSPSESIYFLFVSEEQRGAASQHLVITVGLPGLVSLCPYGERLWSLCSLIGTCSLQTCYLFSQRVTTPKMFFTFLFVYALNKQLSGCCLA